MKQPILLVWAITATALALVLLGYTIGAKSRAVPSVPAGPYGPALTDTQGGESTKQVDPYQVPPAFAGLPSEWRSVFNGTDFRGYAILFDPTHREVIVEKCRHPGYPEQVAGGVRDINWEFCTNVLWGKLTRIDEHSATAVDGNGDPVELEIAVNRDSAAPRLSLSFADHDMNLTPGSKNDYFQEMENSPAMQLEKDLYLENSIAVEQEQRRRDEQAGSQPPPNVPTYSLPATEAERAPPSTSP